MYKYFFLFISIISIKYTSAQNFNGQWKGEFIDKSSSKRNYLGDKCDYVLELDVNDKKVNGSSYTYFTENGKRYYTICEVEGTIETKNKYIEIREIKRIKTNIPSENRNCFQIHKLTYFKKGDMETLEGNWVPAPNQYGNCGFGNTTLSKRSLSSTYPKAFSKLNKEKNGLDVSAPKSNLVINNKQVKPTVKTNPIKENSHSISSATKPNSSIIKKQVNPTVKSNSVKDINKSKISSQYEVKEMEPKDDNFVSADSESKANVSDVKKSSGPKLEKRKNAVLKTIEVDSRIIKIDLYDNGEVDGDSISLFYNDKLLLSNKRLTTKAISLTLNVENDNSINELTMYAENLGSIPPNTALMIITDGPNRYEVRITSDLEKSGVIRFVHKSPK
jgi:hypothetical protein